MGELRGCLIAIGILLALIIVLHLCREADPKCPPGYLYRSPYMEQGYCAPGVEPVP